MIFPILKAVLFGRKCTGIVTGYEIRRTYRGVDYYRYIVTANDKKYISAENLAVYDGRKPTKHLTVRSMFTAVMTAGYAPCIRCVKQ